MTTRSEKLSHTLYECKYHIVFSPKYRYRILKGKVAEQVQQEIYRLCRQKEGVGVIVWAGSLSPSQRWKMVHRRFYCLVD